MREHFESASRKSTPKHGKSFIDVQDVKSVAGLMLGAWALKKFPKTTVIGLIGVGVFLGLTLKEVAKKVDFSSRSSEDLH